MVEITKIKQQADRHSGNPSELVSAPFLHPLSGPRGVALHIPWPGVYTMPPAVRKIEKHGKEWPEFAAATCKAFVS